MLICHKCGAQNDIRNFYCRSCYHQFTEEEKKAAVLRGRSRQTINRMDAFRPPASPGESNPPMEPSTSGEASTSLEDLIQKRLSESREARKGGTPSREEVSVPEFQVVKNSDTPQASRKTLIYVIVGVAALLLVGALFLFVVNSDSSEKGAQSAQLFAQAESFFTAGNHANALRLYRQLVNQYPEDPLAEVARSRMAKVQAALLELERDKLMREQRITLLLEQARKAFARQRYLSPEDDNAELYIREILMLDPAHEEALQLQQKIVDYYTRRGEMAFQKKRYQAARRFFENVLEISPEDAYARELLAEIDAAEAAARRAERQRRQAQKLARSNNPSSSTSKNSPGRSSTSRSETVSKKSAGTGTALSGANSGGSPATSAPVNTASSAGKNTSTAAGASSPQIASTTGTGSTKTPAGRTSKPAPTGTASATGNPNTSTKSSEAVKVIPILDETEIDGGVRQYVLKPQPEVPRTWRYGGFAKVKAECTVGTDGRVEEVLILLPSKFKPLNRLAEETLRKYRYKPATYRGKPVKFKVIEEVVFGRNRQN